MSYLDRSRDWRLMRLAIFIQVWDRCDCMPGLHDTAGHGLHAWSCWGCACASWEQGRPDYWWQGESRAVGERVSLSESGLCLWGEISRYCCSGAYAHHRGGGYAGIYSPQVTTYQFQVKKFMTYQYKISPGLLVRMSSATVHFQYNCSLHLCHAFKH